MRMIAACLLLSLVLFGPLESVAAESTFGQAEALAVREAVAKVENAVVRIELVGVAEQGGGSEVAADAPTVGTVVDPAGYIVASSLVTVRPAASILVVFPDGR